MALHVLDEANRCLGCKKPMCQQGCPIHTNIPEVIRLQTVVRGLFSNSIRPASSSWLFFSSRITSGILVWMGQPC